MRRIAATTLTLLALAACSSPMPDSGAGARGTQAAGPSALPAAASVQSQPLDSEGAAVAAEAAAALGLPSSGAATPAGATAAPMSALTTSVTASAATAPMVAASPEDLPPEGTPVAASLSDEQSFQAVSERETIQSDAERIAQNRAAYVVIQPTELPPRPNGTGASIVQYALRTNNPVGQQMFSRSGFNAEARFARNCAKYTSSDQAQEAFLDSGGPQRDPKGMDPDGDGFACYWDPTPFRTAREGAPEVVTEYVDVEGLGTASN